jgi:hypothetical protein
MAKLHAGALTGNFPTQTESLYRCSVHAPSGFFGECVLPSKSQVEAVRRYRMHSNRGVTNQCKSLCDKSVRVNGNERIREALADQIHFAQTIIVTFLNVFVKCRFTHGH